MMLIMSKIMDRLLGRTQKHTDIMAKNQEVILGTDPKSRKVHDLKNNYTRELIKIGNQARKVTKESNKLTEMIDTAYLIAKSTGNMR